MNYSEEFPQYDGAAEPITEAEIVKQEYELGAEDIRDQQSMAQVALLADTEFIEYLGNILTRSRDSSPESGESSDK
jgi:hypothetical protein